MGLERMIKDDEVGESDERGREVKEIVRLAGRDLEGSRHVRSALTDLKGIGSSMANAIVNAACLDGMRKIGTLDEDEIEKLDGVLQNPKDHGIPKWMVNRRKDYASGDDLHLLGGNIEMVEREDISREKSIKSRRGIRHERGLPVRGQRTRSTGRKGMTVGVDREKLRKK